VVHAVTITTCLGRCQSSHSRIMVPTEYCLVMFPEACISSRDQATRRCLRGMTRKLQMKRFGYPRPVASPQWRVASSRIPLWLSETRFQRSSKPLKTRNDTLQRVTLSNINYSQSLPLLDDCPSVLKMMFLIQNDLP